jgi:hypothetical protein
MPFEGEAAHSKLHQEEPTLHVAVHRTQARTNHYAYRWRTRLPERAVAALERSPKQGESKFSCEVGLGCPSRFAGGQRTVVAPRMQRTPWFLASKIMYAMSQQCSIWRWLSTKTRKCRSSSGSRLTIPSRGRLPACGLQQPLMSNVSRLYHHSMNFHQPTAALAKRHQDELSFRVAAN